MPKVFGVLLAQTALKKSNHFTPTLIQINEQGVIMVYLIYLSQNNAKIHKPSDYATLTENALDDAKCHNINLVPG